MDNAGDITAVVVAAQVVKAIPVNHVSIFHYKMT
jgi:hypothetical protein